MDVFKNGVDSILSGGRGVLADLHLLFTKPETIWQKVQGFDWRVNTSLIMLTAATAAFIGMFLLANIIPEAKPKNVKDPSVVSKPGSPPIPPPTEVVSMRIYPIKSCRGFEITSTRLRKTGLTLDRNWMFISLSDRKFITIRGDASMTLIDTSLVQNPKDENEQMLEISIHNREERVLVPAFPTRQWLEKNTKLSKVEIWENETDGWEYGDEVNKPFCDFFGKPVALIYKGPTDRMVAVNGRKELYGSETPHHFADVMSLQVASEASIKDLQRRLRTKMGDKVPPELTVERFRPNIIVRGRDDKPWEEDTWKRIRITTTLPHEEAIYKLDLDAVARCARCQVPNVDPTTAEKHAKEPWDELMKFRRKLSHHACMEPVAKLC